MAPPRYPELVNVTLYSQRQNIISYGKKIWLQILRRGSYPGLPRWALNASTCILISERRGSSKKDIKGEDGTEERVI